MFSWLLKEPIYLFGQHWHAIDTIAKLQTHNICVSILMGIANIRSVFSDCHSYHCQPMAVSCTTGKITNGINGKTSNTPIVCNAKWKNIWETQNKHPVPRKHEITMLALAKTHDYNRTLYWSISKSKLYPRIKFFFPLTCLYVKAVSVYV